MRSRFSVNRENAHQPITSHGSGLTACSCPCFPENDTRFMAVRDFVFVGTL